MRYQLLSTKNQVLLETDNLEEAAEYLGLSANTLYVRLSASKGTFISGRGALAITVKDLNKLNGTKEKPGPKVKDYRYAATYPDEYPDTFRLPTHEVTLEEIIRVTKLQQDTITHKFASHQTVMALIESHNSYRMEPVVFKRLKPTPELDAVPCEPQVVIDKKPRRYPADKAPPSASPKRSSPAASGRSKK